MFPNSGQFYKVQLLSSLAAGAQLKAKVEMTFSHVLKPFPTHITQAERQLVVFQGNHYLYSPYPTRSQTTRVRLASKTVESYTKLGNPSKNDEIIEYGPFRDVAAFSEVRRRRFLTELFFFFENCANLWLTSFFFHFRVPAPFRIP